MSGLQYHDSQDRKTGLGHTKEPSPLRGGLKWGWSMGGEKVLLVDDDENTRLLYQEELEGEGYSVVTSEGEESIVEVIRRERPQVVLLDINLGMHQTGLDLLQEIKRNDQNLPVILSTAYEKFQHEDRSIAADYYVVKSADLGELKEKLAMAIGLIEKGPS
jgi:DNA-binding NtrC family response regulator